MTRSVTERVVLFGDHRGLVGIVATPGGDRLAAPTVILLNAGIIHRPGPSRLWTGLSRALAAAGIVSLRFDYAGIGDSERRHTTMSLRESMELDLGDAMRYLTSAEGSDRFILVGLCSGAYDALYVAAGVSHVVGALMIDLPGPFQGWRHSLHHLRARLLRPASWREPLRKLRFHTRAFSEPGSSAQDSDDIDLVGGRRTPSREWMNQRFDSLLARGVRLRFVFTAGIQSNYNHRSQFRTTFPRAARHDAVSHDFLPDVDHEISSPEARVRFIADAVRWMTSQPFNHGGRTSLLSA